MIAHDPGPGHPERPDRLTILRDGLELKLEQAGANRDALLNWRRPAPASREAIERVHLSPLLDALEEVRGKHVQLDPDTAMSPQSLDAAHLAAGAAIEAADAALAGDADGAIALVRPPGHHAEAGRPMGFCLFNNVAIAAEHALAKHGLERVLIVDWDVHHGNGTQHSFEDRRDVMFASTHRYPFYPGTGGLHEQGRGAGLGYTINLPLPEAMDDGDYGLMFESVIAPIAQKYDPQLILVSAGFDAHRMDPLGGMKVSHEGFATMCAMLQELAKECYDGTLALILEGGYSLQALVQSVAGCAEILGGETAPEHVNASHRGETLSKHIREAHRKHWSGL